MKAYLDVDGVILTKGGEEMPHLKEFLDILFTVFDGEIYWLTTHCKEEDSTRVLNHLREPLDNDLYERLKSVKPTSWYELKTEAIDFNDEFMWFDDCVFLAEQNILKEKGVLESWIKVENNLEGITKQLMVLYEI